LKKKIEQLEARLVERDNKISSLERENLELRQQMIKQAKTPYAQEEE
jgi:hypothetical protein